MRQSGILAAAGIHALERHVDRLEEDHVLAKEIAAGLSVLDGIDVDLGHVQTNIVLVRVTRPGLAAADLVRELGERGVRAFDTSPSQIRLVTHLDVQESAAREVPRRFHEALRSLVSAAKGGSR